MAIRAPEGAKKDATKTLNSFDLQHIMGCQVIPMHCNAECNQRDVEIHPEKIMQKFNFKKGYQVLALL